MGFNPLEKLKKAVNNVASGIGDAVNDPLKAARYVAGTTAGVVAPGYGTLWGKNGWMSQGVQGEGAKLGLGIDLAAAGMAASGIGGAQLPGLGGGAGATPVALGEAGGYGGAASAASGASGGGLWGLLSTPGVVQAGSTLLGGMLQQSGLNKATDAQTAALDRATAAGNEQFNAVMKRDQPLVDARNESLAKMRELLGIGGSPAQAQAALTSDPGYKFGLDQGRQQLDNSLAAKGMRNSGAALMAAQRYGNDYATTKLDSTLNRYSNLAGMGQVGATAINAAGDANANRASNNALATGNLGAINAIGTGNIWANAGNQLAGWYSNNQRPGG
jgi:hypothetical protein